MGAEDEDFSIVEQGRRRILELLDMVTYVGREHQPSSGGRSDCHRFVACRLMPGDEDHDTWTRAVQQLREVYLQHSVDILSPRFLVATGRGCTVISVADVVPEIQVPPVRWLHYRDW